MENKVREYYNQHAGQEDKRLDLHRFELPVTLHFIRKYLPPGSNVFDAACGTGRYGEELLDRGYHVGFNDLSDENIRLTRQRVAKHENVLFIERADALESPGWRKFKWDGVLLLGPLYHMISRDKRLKLLQTARSSLRKGGVVFSAFMTRTGALIYGLKKNPEGIQSPNGAEKLWKTGTDDDFVEATEWFSHAYFSHPEEIPALIREAGMELLHLAGVEGPFGERFEIFNRMSDELRDAWLDFVLRHCEDPHLVQQSKHLLSVARSQ